MPGIQLPIGIETVNPVDADYKRGPWLTIAAALAGINIALRYNNLSFYVVGDPNEYYWLDTDLSDGGLLIRSSSGGSSLPIIKYVYLVEDPTDAIRMGGAPSNTYTDFQTAWDSAAAIITLNPGYLVVIKVGVTGALLGDLVLDNTNNKGFNILIEGIHPDFSVLGQIDSTGAGLLNDIVLRLKNIQLTNIYSERSILAIGCQNSQVRDFNLLNPSYNIQIISSDNIKVNDCILSGIPGDPSFLQVFGSSYVTLNDITGNEVGLDFGSPINGSNLNPHFTPTVVNNISIFNTNHLDILMRSVTVLGNFTYICGAISVVANKFLFENTKVYGVVDIQRSGDIEEPVMYSCFFDGDVRFTGSVFPSLTIKDTTFKNITDVPDNTTFMNCTVFDKTVATPLINGIGTNCEFYNTSIVGGSFAIDNGVPVSVKFISSRSSNRAPMGANITLT